MPDFSMIRRRMIRQAIAFYGSDIIEKELNDSLKQGAFVALCELIEERGPKPEIDQEILRDIFDPNIYTYASRQEVEALTDFFD